MGLLLDDNSSHHVLCQLNTRFQPGQSLDEMASLQKEFQVFSASHDLSQSFALLNIAPVERAQRQRWNAFVNEKLRSYESDRPGVNGHDRIIQAIEENFGSRSPRPLYFDCHRAKDDPRVTVAQGNPLIYSLQGYVVISIPTTPRRIARAGTGPQRSQA
jgi:hypothetical protein